MASFLAAKGIDSISANIDAVSKIKAITAQHE
jgi:phosphoenolpyruvate synthase/pyruvate phosphate dikinase